MNSLTTSFNLNAKQKTSCQENWRKFSLLFNYWSFSITSILSRTVIKQLQLLFFFPKQILTKQIKQRKMRLKLHRHILRYKMHMYTSRTACIQWDLTLYHKGLFIGRQLSVLFKCLTIQFHYPEKRMTRRVICKHLSTSPLFEIAIGNSTENVIMISLTRLTSVRST